MERVQMLKLKIIKLEECVTHSEELVKFAKELEADLKALSVAEAMVLYADGYGEKLDKINERISNLGKEVE